VTLEHAEVTYYLAFTAGALSFFSPCVLPLLPAYMSYITGLTIEEYSGQLSPQARRKMVLNTLFFILGFSTVFIGVFGLGTSFLGGTLGSNKHIISKIGGVIIIIFGLHFMGVFRIKWLYKEKRFHMKKLPTGYIGSFLIGVTFSAGWTPCVGPILGAILGMSVSAEGSNEPLILLALYTLGLAIPFFLTSLAINVFMPLFNRVKHHFKIVNIVTGLLLILMGVLMITGTFNRFSGLIQGLIS